ncbi:Diphthamide biosynthesis protein 4 [Sphaceloma murrayae]|uniref:Diphthamide biosynthesis protein 4 n=1 Tax=Sphaceloma murrayae TaxID=2082308 RepID=A0A2K1QSB1_9PEZI|nr:Diphthamide biosynthesis protein 4 [Sphaceloma murrayae]
MEDYYLVLGLASRRYDPSLTVQDVRKAYREALLRYHPDKVDSANRRDGGTLTDSLSSKYTVDQIASASSILSDPALRAEYDRKLNANGRSEASISNKGPARFFSGLDVVDLDDLEYDEKTGTWRRSCRCGHEEGFVVSEDELDVAASVGELVVGCRGCSLWLKVLFQVAAEEEGKTTG